MQHCLFGKAQFDSESTCSVMKYLADRNAKFREAKWEIGWVSDEKRGLKTTRVGGGTCTPGNGCVTQSLVKYYSERMLSAISA